MKMPDFSVQFLGAHWEEVYIRQYPRRLASDHPSGHELLGGLGLITVGAMRRAYRWLSFQSGYSEVGPGPPSSPEDLLRFERRDNKPRMPRIALALMRDS